jgi:chemotaxis protein MotB
MAKQKRPIIVKQGLAGWVMTYGDMMSLLLTFFVLIVSFSSMQDAKFKEVALSLRKAFGIMIQPQSVVRVADPVIPRFDNEERRDIVLEVDEVRQELTALGLSSEVELDFVPDGIMFRLEAPVLFAPGSSELAAGSHAPLDVVAGFLQKFSGEIRVEGHADTTAIRTARFPSNWELSASRAGAVARYFQGSGLAPERLAATGFAEYRPLADNATAEGRARNRRVEVFLKVDRNQSQGVRKPLSQALDPSGGDSPRPTPVTDRLRSLQSR